MVFLNLNNMKEKFKTTQRLCTCIPSRTFLRTRQGLAYTPSEMLSLAERGIPVNQANVGENNFYDGEINPSWSVPIERDRGVDIADVWQMQMESRSKMRNAHRLDIAKHGLTPKIESDG